MKLPTYTNRRGPFEIQMTPLIDVTFLLLVFFVWTASFRVAENILPSSVSAAAGTAPARSDEPPPAEADFEKIVIRIVWHENQPVWQLNGQAFTELPQLKTRLLAIAAIKKDSPVILHPDPAIPLGDVIDVYDLARMAGLSKVQFAAALATAGP